MKQVLPKKGALTFVIDESQDNADKYFEEHTDCLKLGFGELVGQWILE